MRLFKRGTTDKLADRKHLENVNDRLRLLVSKETEYEDPSSVEARLRNMNYGTSRK